MSRLRNNDILPLAAMLLLIVTVFVAGYYEGASQVEQAREAEYVRVVGALARTMRCSTEEEWARGEDHECDPSEVEQDAGLVDERGARVR